MLGLMFSSIGGLVVAAILKRLENVVKEYISATANMFTAVLELVSIVFFINIILIFFSERSNEDSISYLFLFKGYYFAHSLKRNFYKTTIERLSCHLKKKKEQKMVVIDLRNTCHNSYLLLYLLYKQWPC